MTETRQLVIVRRNQLAAFAMLAQAFADEPGVRLTWDRRLRQRRKASTSLDPEERRRRDRRCDPWTTWGRTDYLLVGVTKAGTEGTGEIARPDADSDEHMRASEGVRRDIEAAVRSNVAVLISGGDPVSRKSLAHQIHRRSGRSGRPLFVVERDALTEFFREGTEGGTVLIEEIADLSCEEQSELLLFLEPAVRRNDARIISETSHWLFDRVASKQFRADLFYRLNAIHLVLPSGSVRTFG